MKTNLRLISLLALGLLMSQCDPAKRMVASDADLNTISNTMQTQAPDEPEMVKSMQSDFVAGAPSGSETPTKGSVPIDRVKLKGSPRGILTWRADYAWDTAATVEGLGSFEAKKEGSVLKVNHIFNGITTTIFTSPIMPGSIAQMGLYKHILNNAEHVIVFYSEDANQIKAIVVKAANNLNIPFLAPATNLANPIPYYELATNKLNLFNDINAPMPFKSYTCVNNQMVQN